MNDAAITFGPALVVVLILLTVTGAAVVRWGELGQGRAVLIAAARDRAARRRVSGDHRRPAVGPLTGLFVLLMFGIAAVTSARRTGPWRNLPWTALAIAAGVIPVLALVLGTGVVPPKPIASCRSPAS